jgi:hypothetical protein
MQKRAARAREKPLKFLECPDTLEQYDIRIRAGGRGFYCYENKHSTTIGIRIGIRPDQFERLKQEVTELLVMASGEIMADKARFLRRGRSKLKKSEGWKLSYNDRAVNLSLEVPYCTKKQIENAAFALDRIGNHIKISSGYIIRRY